MGNKATVGAKCTEWRIRGVSTERTTEVIVSSGLSEGTIMLCSTGNEARMLIKFTPHQFLEFKSMVDHCAKRFEQANKANELTIWFENFSDCNDSFWVYLNGQVHAAGYLTVCDELDKWIYKTCECVAYNGPSWLTGKMNGSQHDVKVLEAIRQELQGYFSAPFVAKAVA